EVAETPWTAIPGTTFDAIRRMVIDQVCITYMGAAFTGKALLAYAKELGGRPEAVLIGDGARVPAELAAGVNGQLCRQTNFQETGPGTHIGPLCVHTALAVGQRTRASGRDVMTATSLGYVLAGRFHFSRVRDWPRTGPVQHRTVAAAIASRLLGHDAATTARAMSLAWEMPPRKNMTDDPFIAKRMSPFAQAAGIAVPLVNARMGVQAAVMAGHGFESAPDEIDEHRNDYDVPVLVGQPTPYHWVEEEMELKPWVSSAHGQAANQAVAELMGEHSLDPRSITGVRLYLSNMYTRPWQDEPAPDNYWEAIYSTQWGTAMIILGIPAGPKWASKERIADPLSRRLSAMVKIIEDPEATRAYWGKEGESLARARGSRDGVNWFDIAGTAEIDSGGQTYRKRLTMRETYGRPGKQMTEAMVRKKFLESTSLSLTRERALSLYRALQEIDHVPDINDLAAQF
ncbi:MAG: MmgE/PrpD family protein, partial [Alphaproteobacteria bacterium]|nr:MmgE/PrpD family protein [Alphaproteobacteria bacterium]